jgi:Na+/H+ antiporter
MHLSLLVALGIALAVLGSVALSRKSSVPLPVFLVVAGVLASFAPGFESVRLPPDVVFYGFLPPLLYSAGFLTAPREARENWLPIALLAFGLVLATLFAVGGVVTIAVGGLGAGAAFVLGAVLAPTDPIAATSVIQRVNAPSRVRTILEGESLVNDGIALVVFSIALHAATRGSFSVADGLLRFLQVAGGGAALGLALGFLVERIRRRVHDLQLEITISLLTPYAAYLPAERAHVSGVLATVAAGVYLGWHSGGIFKPETRLQSRVFWDVLVFLLTAILFVLLGTQFRSVVSGLGRYSPWSLAWYAVVVATVVSVVRIAWMFTVPYLVTLVRPRERGWRESVSPWRDRLVLGWSGLRGAVSLAAALSISAAVAYRDLILYLTFTTILAGLLVQGVTLPWLLGRLGFGAAEGMSEREARARLTLTECALARLDELTSEEWIPPDALAPLRQLYEGRLDRLGGVLDEEERDGAGDPGAFGRAQREVIRAQRRRLDELAVQGQVSTDTARQLERELDLEETRLAS